MSCAGVSAKASYPQQMYPANCNRRQHQPFNWRGDPGGKDIIFVDGHKYEWVLKFERSCVLKDYPVISIHNCSSICQRHMFDVCVCVCVCARNINTASTICYFFSSISFYFSTVLVLLVCTAY